MHTDLVWLDALAVRQSVDLVELVSGVDLGRPTPCAGWTVADLVGHMTAQHRGFAAAAQGSGDDRAQWTVRPAADPVAAYRVAAADVIAAFAAVGSAEQPFALPEIARRPVPAERAIGFHLLDYLVHGWDVAASLGLPYEPDRAVLLAALPIALAVPDGRSRLAPGAAFAPALDGEPGSAFHRVLRHLGRSPHWQAAAETPTA